jgi:CRP/FNR family nitrogen fixation transcriptional regulator
MQTAPTTARPEIASAAARFAYGQPIRRAPESPTLGSTRTFAKGAEIFAEGDRAAFFYKVASGAVRTSKLLSDGRRQIDAFHLPGDIFGIGAGDEHRFSAEALGGATVIAYRRCSLETLAANDSAVSRQVVTAMMRALERAQNHMLLLGRKSAMERIATFLLDLAGRTSENGQVDLPMSRIDIADYLGLTIETVSRSLTQLERQGAIEVPAHRRSIVLRDTAALQRLDD